MRISCASIARCWCFWVWPAEWCPGTLIWSWAKGLGLGHLNDLSGSCLVAIGSGHCQDRARTGKHLPTLSICRSCSTSPTRNRCRKGQMPAPEKFARHHGQDPCRRRPGGGACRGADPGLRTGWLCRRGGERSLRHLQPPANANSVGPT
jgi:hypothetical protein